MKVYTVQADHYHDVVWFIDLPPELEYPYALVATTDEDVLDITVGKISDLTGLDESEFGVIVEWREA